jgi:hypothetical protein
MKKILSLTFFAVTLLAQQPVAVRDPATGNTAAVTSGSAVKTDASATTQPVSAASLPLPTGAATAAKQPALGTAGSASADVISVQGEASMTALKTDGSGVTQPVSAASLPLPTGASTAAKHPALGTAGSASADVISVQGVASMTALKVDGSGVTQPVSGTVTAAGAAASGASKSGNPVQVGAVFNTTQPTVTTGQAVEAQATARGARIVATGVDTFNVTVSAALPAGTNVIGHTIIDSGSTTAVTSLPATPAGTNLIGEVAPMASAATTDAASTFALQSAASNNSSSVKGSAGNIYGIYIINTTTTNYFLRLYNASSAPTCSSATGFIETIPALGAAANGGGISRMQWPQAFGTGIGLCLTGGGGSTDNTNAATGVYVTVLYK